MESIISQLDEVELTSDDVGVDTQSGEIVEGDPALLSGGNLCKWRRGRGYLAF
jgi:hypothetical protein